MNKLQIYMEQYGFTPVEIKLYLGLLQNGPSSVLELANQSKINRTTAHINIESLIKKGMATHIKVGARRKIIAEPPEKLKTFLDQEKLQVKQKENNYNELLKSIYETVGGVKENTRSEVRYYEGKDAVSKLYDDILKSDEVKTYASLEQIVSAFPENVEKFVNAIKRGVIVWDLQVHSSKENLVLDEVKGFNNYQNKFFPKDIKMHSMDYLIYSDCIATIQGGDNPVGIVIKNKNLAENARVLYDLMWRLL